MNVWKEAFFFGGGLTIHVSILVHINNVSLSLSVSFSYLCRWWFTSQMRMTAHQSLCTPFTVETTSLRPPQLVHHYCRVSVCFSICLSSHLCYSLTFCLCPCFSPGGPALEAGAVAVCSPGATVSSTQSCNYEIIHYGSTFWVVNGL